VVETGYALKSEGCDERLALRRAQRIKGYLVTKGIDPNRIYTEGKISRMGDGTPKDHDSGAVVELEGEVN
jgi:hypothetical protein